MPNNNDIEINYIMKAIDKASKEIEKVTKKTKDLEKAMLNADKATKKVEKSNIDISKSVDEIANTTKNTIDIVKNFYKALTSFNFQKFARILRLVAMLLKFKGMDKTAASISFAADKIEYFGDKVDKFREKVDKAKEQYGSLLGLFYAKSGLKGLVDLFGSVALKVAGAGVAFVALAASSKAVGFVTQAVYGLETAWLKMDFHVWNSLSQTFPRLADMLMTISDKAFRGFAVFAGSLRKTNIVLGKAAQASRVLAKESTRLAGTTMKAAMATEFGHKGFIALATQSAALGGAMALLGKTLLDSDSILLKFAGTITLALAALAGFSAYIIKSFIGAIGRAVSWVGDKLVNSLEGAIQKFIKLHDATASFTFLINNLSKESEGATGSIESWNKQIEKVSKSAAYTKTELRKAVGELVSLGKAFHLNKGQMEELLPIIADVASFSGDNLFDATMRVTEAIGGMTQATAKYGIVLSEETLMHSKAYKVLGRKLSTLSEAEKAQLRYKVMLEKTSVIQGYAVNSLNTYAGAMRLSKVANEKFSASLGEGALAFDEMLITRTANATDVLAGMSTGLLKVTGFLGSFLGRLFQGVGFITQWSFAIVMATTSYRALNVLLSSQVLRRWTMQLARSTVIMKALNLVSKDFANTVKWQMVGVSKSLGGTSSVLKLLRLGFIGLGKAVWGALAPFLLIGAKIALVVGAIYLVYKGFQLVYRALVLIDEETKVFSNMWAAIKMVVAAVKEAIKVWWELPGLFSKIGEKIKELAKWFSDGLPNAIVWTAVKLLQLVIVAQVMKIGVVTAIRIIIDSFWKMYDAAAEVLGKFGGFAKKWGSKALSLIGINTAWAGSVGAVNKELDKTRNKSVVGEQSQKDAVATIVSLNSLITKIREKNAVLKEGKEENGHDKAVEEALTRVTLLEEIEGAAALRKSERKALEVLETQLQNDDEFLFLSDNLGKQEALKVMYETERARKEANQLKTKAEREKAHMAIMDKLTVAHRKAAEQNFFHVKKFEDLTAREKIGRTKATLGTISSLTGQKNKELFMIGKAAALANATIDITTGVLKAWAMGPILGPILAPIVAVAGALQMAKIAGQKPPAYYNSGTIQGPMSGDSVQVNANGGETILNTSDSRNLLDIARFGGAGGGGNDAAIRDLAEAIRNQAVSIQIDGREIARTVRNEVQSGYAIA